MRIQVITVNHGTTDYAELLIRSLLRHHPDRPDIEILVLDNESDGFERLRQFVADGVVIERSGYGIAHTLTTHGEILRNAILAHPDCDAYLIVDCDVCFRTDDTIGKLASELAADFGLFAVQATWLTQDETPLPASDPFAPMPVSTVRESVRGSADAPWSDPIEYRVELQLTDRVNPFCALIRNSPELRLAVEHVGLSPAVVQSERGGKWWDSLGMLTQIMKTHGLTWKQSDVGVIHFGNVSWDPTWATEKAAARDKLLAEYR